KPRKRGRTILLRREHPLMIAITSASHSRDRAAIQIATSMATERLRGTSSCDACKESSAEVSQGADRWSQHLAVVPHRSATSSSPLRVPDAQRTDCIATCSVNSTQVAPLYPAWGQPWLLQPSDFWCLYGDATAQLARSDLLHQPLSLQNRVRRSCRASRRSCDQIAQSKTEWCHLADRRAVQRDEPHRHHNERPSQCDNRRWISLHLSTKYRAEEFAIREPCPGTCDCTPSVCGRTSSRMLPACAFTAQQPGSAPFQRYSVVLLHHRSAPTRI